MEIVEVPLTNRMDAMYICIGATVNVYVCSGGYYRQRGFVCEHRADQQGNPIYVMLDYRP